MLETPSLFAAKRLFFHHKHPSVQQLRAALRTLGEPVDSVFPECKDFRLKCGDSPQFQGRCALQHPGRSHPRAHSVQLAVLCDCAHSTACTLTDDCTTPSQTPLPDHFQSCRIQSKGCLVDTGWEIL